MRTVPSAQEIRQLLALAGLDADAEALEVLRRRMGFFQDAMNALDRMDLGSRDPAFLFVPDPDEA